MAKRFLLSVLRIAIALIVLGALAWWSMIRMPGKDPAHFAQMSAETANLRAELKADVQKLAGDIGERNVARYPALDAAANFIEQSFAAAGLKSRRQTYQVRRKDCHNIEAEIKGASSKIILVGAHYDSVFGAPGANDNGSGVAALLALARRFASKKYDYTLRFVAFVNEEPPYFQTEEMGSLVYAKACRQRNDAVEAMVSLETIGYFSDEPNTQSYPIAALRLVYPKVGNFIGVVGNFQSRALVRKTVRLLRKNAVVPTEGGALPSIVPGVGWSDQWAFWQCGYRGIMITDSAPFRYPYYHQPADTPDKLDYDRFALVVNGMEKVVSELAANGP